MTGYGKRVLLADDEETVRKLLTVQLEQWGFLVIQACDGRQALSELRKRHFDVVVSDIQMPHLDGLNFLRQSRMGWPELPVILISGNGQQGAELAMVRGAAAFLAKPIDAAQLLRAVSMAMNQPVAL